MCFTHLAQIATILLRCYYGQVHINVLYICRLLTVLLRKQTTPNAKYVVSENVTEKQKAILCVCPVHARSQPQTVNHCTKVSHPPCLQPR
mmetsp:Transcript_30559/g.45537  ORF Transcript_30559/g.45537 Transcript_30559/m.45537 type:complete len:90 (+) Transcript_30559:100-369(+)